MLKDESLLVNILASNNCLQLQKHLPKWCQHFVKTRWWLFVKKVKILSSLEYLIRDASFLLSEFRLSWSPNSLHFYLFSPFWRLLAQIYAPFQTFQAFSFRSAYIPDPIMFKSCKLVERTLTKELQMEFPTSDVSICNGDMKYPIRTSTFHMDVCVQALSCCYYYYCLQ